MQLHHTLIVLVAGFLGQASKAVVATSNNQLNGWYPCSIDTQSTEANNGELSAECATFAAPLCYPGICEAPVNATDQTIDVFVKRLPASSINAEEASNVWMIPGGPGNPSLALERSMVTLHASLNGSVNVFAMDPRGVRRSTRLDCVSSQTTTSGSRSSRTVDPSEVPSCAKELHMRYGDLASFSTTSVAMDIATFISTYVNGARTIVYGVSYGTMVAQRLMHLNPKNVAGYVLDSIVTSSGPPVDRVYFTNWDTDSSEVGEQFMDLCAQDRNCAAHFNVTNLSTTLRNMISRFEVDPNSTCANVIRNATQDEPSVALRRTMSGILMYPVTRTLIPPVVYRLNRCDANDVNALTRFFKRRFPSTPRMDENLDLNSLLLYYLIIFSEMWETPTNSFAELENRFTSVSIPSGAIHTTLPLYCAFSKEKSPACDVYGDGNYEANGIIYARDQYWNKTAAVPDQASVLLMSGKLDPQTPYKYAESLFLALDTPRKELIVFDHAPHLLLDTTPYGDGTKTCGMNLLASYVANNGDLSLLDKSCMSEMPALNMTLTPEVAGFFFGTNEAYDGVATPAAFDEGVELQ